MKLPLSAVNNGVATFRGFGHYDFPTTLGLGIEFQNGDTGSRLLGGFDKHYGNVLSYHYVNRLVICDFASTRCLVSTVATYSILVTDLLYLKNVESH